MKIQIKIINNENTGNKIKKEENQKKKIKK